MEEASKRFEYPTRDKVVNGLKVLGINTHDKSRKELRDIINNLNRGNVVVLFNKVWHGAPLARFIHFFHLERNTTVAIIKGKHVVDTHGVVQKLKEYLAFPFRNPEIESVPMIDSQYVSFFDMAFSLTTLPQDFRVVFWYSPTEPFALQGSVGESNTIFYFYSPTGSVVKFPCVSFTRINEAFLLPDELNPANSESDDLLLTDYITEITRIRVSIPSLRIILVGENDAIKRLCMTFWSWGYYQTQCVDLKCRNIFTFLNFDDFISKEGATLRSEEIPPFEQFSSLVEKLKYIGPTFSVITELALHFLCSGVPSNILFGKFLEVPYAQAERSKISKVDPKKLPMDYLVGLYLSQDLRVKELSEVLSKEANLDSTYLETFLENYKVVTNYETTGKYVKSSVPKSFNPRDPKARELLLKALKLFASE